MSHFSTIKTKIRDKQILIKALNILEYNILEDQELYVSGNHGIGHEKVDAEVSIASDIGFRLNVTNKLQDRFLITIDILNEGFWFQKSIQGTNRGSKS